MFFDEQNRIAFERPRLASETAGPVGDQQFRLAELACVEKDLARLGTWGGVLPCQQ
jgi:hypothetical protein